MNSNPRLTYAIAAILSGNVAGLSYAAAPAAEAESSSDSIQEITVTAQRRTENMQDVPIQIQALTGETLTQLNVSTFDDFVKYLPNVSSASNGPGQGVIFMRGLATSTLATQGSSGIGSFPNVAVYLDDQSGQLPGRNLDVYAADIERIEVLEGPQGTLFGAGAQAGVLRYITNKPKLDVSEGNVNAGFAYTSGGDHSSNADAMINLPLIPDTLAVRGVIYSDTRGGYINNVPGTFTRLPTDIGIHYGGYATGCPTGSTLAAGACSGGATPTAYGVPPGSPSINNNNLVANAINPVTYKGIRVSALYKFNEDWNALLVQSYQQMESQGVFFVTPQSSAGEVLPDLAVQLYNPSFNNDKFENTALTINGRIGDLKTVYAGSYMVRNIDQAGDYTNYARGVYADYYQCTNPATEPGTTSKCYSPSASWRETDTATHNSQELRLSTPDDWRMRAIGGLFWEDYKIKENIDWMYKNLPACTTAADIGCLTNVGPAPGADVRNPNIRNDNTSFFDDITRGYTQKAVFGSIDFDIIPKVLTITAGTRYYQINTTAVGSSVSSFGCYAGGPPPCTGNVSYSNNLSAQNLDITYKGFKSRGNISWKPMEDVLLYYTWSQGFRPGGFNRGAHIADHSVNTVNGASYVYQSPSAYAPDTLVNNEVGWKTQWFDRRLEFNGAVYQEDWKDVQVQIFQSCCYGNLSFVTNGPNYRVRGVETEFVARVTHELTVTGSASWNSSNLTNAPSLLSTTGQPIIIPQVGTVGGSAFGQTGSPLAQSPPFQASLRARYEFAVGDYKAFWQIGGTHQAHSYSATGNITTYDQASFSTYDASMGLAKDAWAAQLYGQNLTNVRANLFENGNQFITAETISRPRTAGVKFSYKF
ncbi:MAG TPA: TonB-dependent receptor [Steroidobacteraceae bacterium]|jgi:outer membrane receptor protein involved in Fe transport